MMDNNAENKRTHTRVGFNVEAKVIFFDRTFDNCKVRDLSLDGIFLKDIEDVTVGEECDIELVLKGKSSDLALKMDGKVARLENGGAAIKFSMLNSDTFYHLRNIIYYNSDDPDKVLLEFRESFFKEN